MSSLWMWQKLSSLRCEANSWPALQNSFSQVKATGRRCRLTNGARKCTQLIRRRSMSKDFLSNDCSHKPLEELYYDYCVLVKQDMLNSLSDAMPLNAHSTSTYPGTTVSPKPVTTVRGRERVEEILGAPMEMKRSDDEKAIFNFKAETARSNTGVAKGNADLAKRRNHGKLKVERQVLKQDVERGRGHRLFRPRAEHDSYQ